MPEQTITMADGSVVTGSWQEPPLHRAAADIRWVHGLVTCERCGRSWAANAGSEIKCSKCAGKEE